MSDETQAIATADAALTMIDAIATATDEERIIAAIRGLRWEWVENRREQRNKVGPAIERIDDIDEHVKGLCEVATDGAIALTMVRDELASLGAQLADMRTALTTTMRKLELERALGDHATLAPAQRALLRRAYEGDAFPADAAAWLAERLAAITGASPVGASTQLAERARRVRDAMKG
jgi:hypothetical protein